VSSATAGAAEAPGPTRRALIALPAALLPFMAGAEARAAGWPDRPVRLVVPYAPGGNADFTARAASPRMAEALGQPVVVENRAGAGGSIAAAQVARTRPDGLTILLGSNGPLAINPAVQANLGYDPLRDFAPVGLFVRTPVAVTVHRNLPPRNLAELVAYAKANPGKVGFGSSGIASTAHLSLEMFNAATGADITHVPYGSGGAMAPDLVSGTIAGAITEISTALPLHREGAVRILAVAAARRLPVLPDVPTAEEAGVPGFEAAAFVGIVVPTGVPEEATAALARAVAAAVADPAVRGRLEGMGSVMATAEEATPAGFAALLRRETAWTRAAAERAGLRPG
jgi:tripartite-type tricarboxylate transporter receptor subunit TctC